jgi:hypothetical protein
MIDSQEEDNLEKFGPQPTCENEECQAMYCRYKAIYTKYYENLQRVHTLTHENQLISSEIKHKVALLELDKQQLGYMLEQEKQVSDILQHKTDVSVNNINGGLHPVCTGCMYHRAALIQHRTLNSDNYPNVRRIHEENQRILESCKEELLVEKLINAKFRIRMGKNVDPFWKDQEVLQLRGELSQYKEMFEESKSNADSLKEELHKCKELLLILKQNRDMLENELVKSKMASKNESETADDENQHRMSGKKRKLSGDFDESADLALENGKGKKPLMAVMNTVLEHRFGLVFFIDSEHGCEHEENFLYDIFRQSIDSDDLERCFESVYKACHPEESFSLRDRKLLKEGLVRVCKGPFGACLKALGGESKKRGTQIIWTNVKIRKA